MGISDITNFSDAFNWVIAHGYFLMFVAMLIEGPVVTAAAAFAAALGYFSLPIIFILSLFGDIVADVIYYLIGYFSRISVVERFGKYFGLTEKRMKKIETLLNNHPIKTLIALKLTPVLPTPGLMIVGATRMPLRKFIIICAVIVLPKTVLFMLTGYYFGQAYDLIAKKFEQGGVAIAIAILFILVIYFIYNKVSAYVATKVEKI